MISSLRFTYRDYSKLPAALMGKLTTEIMAELADNVIKPFYKREELLPGANHDRSENSADGDEAELMDVQTPNLINKSMPIYKTEGETVAQTSVEKKEETKEETKLVVGMSRKRKAPEEAGPQQVAELRAELTERVTKKKDKSKVKKTEESRGHAIDSSISFKDLGGIDDIFSDIRETIEWPLRYIKIYNYLGIQPPRGVLLCGPPGCGKTTLAMAICGEFGVPFFKISGPEIVSGMSGESEQKIRELFKEVTAAAPSILFIDEIDSIAGKREAAFKDMEKRIVAQFLTCIDDLGTMCDPQKPVILIGATNRPEHLDPALRRAGRFDREITMGVPNEKAREQIIRKMCSKLKLGEDCDCAEIARMSPGYVGADLSALVKEAAIAAIKRIFMGMKKEGEEEFDVESLSEAEMSKIRIEKRDFMCAIKKVQPSAMREGFTTIPNVTWDHVGALAEIREELKMSIVEPIKSPELFAQVGLTAPAGVLLYGPPGCGKTLVAKAVSNESKANFISIKGPELLNKYVGESEKAIRQLFHRARMSSPCIIFFDELDALCPKRGSEQNSVTERVVNQLLTELDGLEERRNVFVIAATNRPDIIDPAMLRPGRLDKLLYVPLPNEADRLSILETLCKDKPVDPAVDLKAVAYDQRCTVPISCGSNNE